MKYVIGKICYSQEPTDWMITNRNPFDIDKIYAYDYVYNSFSGSHSPIDPRFALVEDFPGTLARAHELGFCFKPQAYEGYDLHNTKINTIILDFKHLDEEQYNHIKEKCLQKGIPFEYSAEVKTKLARNEEITVWKIKVFYPCETIATKRCLERAFLKAVKFFNDEAFGARYMTESIWRKWLQVNNKESEMSNPIFAGWALPDVAMLESYRTQITYSCDVLQAMLCREVSYDEIISNLQSNGHSKFYRYYNSVLRNKCTTRVSTKSDWLHKLPWTPEEYIQNLENNPSSLKFEPSEELLKIEDDLEKDILDYWRYYYAP